MQLMILWWFVTNDTISPSPSPVQRGGPPSGLFGPIGDAFKAIKHSILSRTLSFLWGITDLSLIWCRRQANSLLACSGALSMIWCVHWQCFLVPVQLLFMDRWGTWKRVPSFVILLCCSRCLKGLLAFLTPLHRRQDRFGVRALVCLVVCICCRREVVGICWWTGVFGFSLAVKISIQGHGLKLLKEFLACAIHLPVYIQIPLWPHGHCRLYGQTFVGLLPVKPGLHWVTHISTPVACYAFNWFWFFHFRDHCRVGWTFKITFLGVTFRDN